MKENKRVNDRPKTTKTPEQFNYETLAKGGNLKRNGEPYQDGKVKSVSVLSDPQNTLNKNLPVKAIFKKMDRDNEKKKGPAKDDSIYYYTKTLGDLTKKDGDKVPKVTPIDGEDDMKVLYNKLRGDMTNRPEDKKNDVFILKAPKNANIDKSLPNLKLLGKEIVKPEKKPFPEDGRRPLRSVPKPGEEPGIEKVDVDDDNFECVKVSGDELVKYANEPKDKDGIVLRLRTLFKEANDADSGVNYLYRKVLSSGVDKPDSSQLKDVPGERKVDDVYEDVKAKEGDFTSPEEGIQLVKTVGNINPDDITKHMEEAKQLYDKKDDDGLASGTTVQCVKVTKTNKDGKKEHVTYIKAVKGGAKAGEEPIAYYKIKDGTDVRDVLDQIQEKGKPDGTDGVDYNKVKGDELPEVKKLFEGSENIPKTYYYTTNVKGAGVDKFGKPYGDGKVHSVTVISDPQNKTNKPYKVEQVFRKAEEANNKKDKEQDKAKYYYIKLLGAKANKEAKPPLSKTDGDADITDVYNKLKGDLAYKPGMGDENDAVLLIKSKVDMKDKDLADKIQPKLKESKPKKAPKRDLDRGEPTYPRDERPGLEKVDVGDDKFQCVKITGDQLNKLANPTNRDEPIDKVKDVVKDADEDDLGTKYFYRKIVGGGLDKPDDTQLVEVPPTKNMDEIYDRIRATSGGINKPDEGVQLVKVVGDVKPNEVNDHLKENKKVNDKPRTTKTPMTCDLETKTKGDGRIKSVNVLSDPQNTLNKNLPVKAVFRKNDRDNEKKKGPEKDNSVYYYTKTLGDLTKKDGDKVPKVTPIDSEDDMKVLYNKLRGDMTNKPDDKNNDVFIIKAPKNENVDKVLPNLKLLGKLLTKPEHKPEEQEQEQEPTRELPEETSPEKPRPGIETFDIGDDKVKLVKITGDELTRLANPENKDVPVDKVKDADEEDLCTKYFFTLAL